MSFWTNAETSSQVVMILCCYFNIVCAVCIQSLAKIFNKFTLCCIYGEDDYIVQELMDIMGDQVKYIPEIYCCI